MIKIFLVQRGVVANELDCNISVNHHPSVSSCFFFSPPPSSSSSSSSFPSSSSSYFPFLFLLLFLFFSSPSSSSFLFSFLFFSTLFFFLPFFSAFLSSFHPFPLLLSYFPSFLSLSFSSLLSLFPLLSFPHSPPFSLFPSFLLSFFYPFFSSIPLYSPLFPLFLLCLLFFTWQLLFFSFWHLTTNNFDTRPIKRHDPCMYLWGEPKTAPSPCSLKQMFYYTDFSSLVKWNITPLFFVFFFPHFILKLLKIQLRLWFNPFSFFSHQC